MLGGGKGRYVRIGQWVRSNYGRSKGSCATKKRKVQRTSVIQEKQMLETRSNIKTFRRLNSCELDVTKMPKIEENDWIFAKNTLMMNKRRRRDTAEYERIKGGIYELIVKWKEGNRQKGGIFLISHFGAQRWTIMTMAIMVIILSCCLLWGADKKKTNGRVFFFGDVKEVAFEAANIKETAIAGQKP